MSTDIDISHKIAAPACIPADDSAPSDRALTVIEPVRGWQPINFRELWAFKELIYFLAWRDVKVRYKQTALGMAWAVLQPAMLMIVFTIFADQVAGSVAGALPAPLFMYLGVLPWTFFSTAIGSAGNSVVGSERLVAKVYFPRLAVPIASAGAATVDFGIASLLLVGLMGYYHVAPGAWIVITPLVFLVLMLTALGIGTLLAALNVMYRDFRYVIPFMVQIWMLATPAIYKDPKTFSDKLKLLHHINPISGLIGTFRDACVGNSVDLPQLAMSAVVSVVLFLCGCWYFRRLERRFADVI
jgi:lipopolysaccharide transport system permease protein